MQSEQHRRTACALGVVVILAAVLLSRPWVGEDVHITLRTIENFVGGYGLRWNIDERVQTYTHPLWLFVLTALYVVTHEIYFTVTALSLLLVAGAYLLLARRMPAMVAIFVAAMYCASIALLDFSTSGFENPLTLFLLSAFVAVLLREGTPAWGTLSFIASLAMLNRLDTAVLVAPVFLFLVARGKPGIRGLVRSAIGFGPLFAWLLFSLFYYGFFVPNTAPAKLSADIDTMSYVHTGLRDLVQLVRADRGGGAVLLLGLAAAGRVLVAFARGRRDARTGALAALAIGLLCQIGYTIRVGGDFIVGRFWTTQLWISIVLAAEVLTELWTAWLVSRRVSRAVGLVAAVAGFVVGAEVFVSLVIAPFYFGPRAIRKWGGDGMTVYRSLARAELQRDLTWTLTDVARDWREEGVQARRHLAETGQRVLVTATVGFTGLAAGRDVIIVDPLALADPLLAHLPPARRTLWLAGHVRRAIPRGYLHARETGSTEEMEPAMRTYYDALRLVVSGPLFSAERLHALLALHTKRIVPPKTYEADPPPR